MKYNDQSEKLVNFCGCQQIKKIIISDRAVKSGRVFKWIEIINETDTIQA